MKHQFPALPLVFGGQVIEELTSWDFAQLFKETNALQYKDEGSLVEWLGLDTELMPQAFESSVVSVYEAIGQERMLQYLSSELTLVLSQGCIYRCTWCGGKKGRKEEHVEMAVYEENLRCLVSLARKFGLASLECYASPLDTFQNPKTIKEYLEVLAEVREETGFDIKVRCLSCVKSFMRASREIENFAELLHRAGVWCVGFGIDGAIDPRSWARQRKNHNDPEEIQETLDLCEQIGIRAEVLLVMGEKNDSLFNLVRLIANCFMYVWHWQCTVLRPYVNKSPIPGDDYWIIDEKARTIIKQPSLFYNLDFAAFASRLTHPSLIYRWLVNLTYLCIFVLFIPMGRCPNSPLFIQGGKGLGAKIATLLNRFMPLDR
jgi:hypothetical protein